MERVLPSADVPGWERQLPDVPDLPDLADRHVLAAALEAPAPTILTLNLRDYPAALSRRSALRRSTRTPS